MRRAGWLGVVAIMVLGTTVAAATQTLGSGTSPGQGMILTLMNWMHHDTLLDAGDVKDRAESNFVVVDLRTPEDYARGHLPGAVNIPEYNVVAHIGAVVADHDQPVLLYGYDERQSIRSVLALKMTSYNQVFHLADGWQNPAQINN